MAFLLESLIACAAFTLFVFLMSRNPIKSLVLKQVYRGLRMLNL